MSREVRALDLDREALVREDWHYDHADDTVRLTQAQEVAPIVEFARAHHDATPDKHGRWRGELVPVATIPNTMLLELMRLGVLGRGFRVLDERRFYSWLQEHSYFKTTPGRF